MPDQETSTSVIQYMSDVMSRASTLTQLVLTILVLVLASVVVKFSAKYQRSNLNATAEARRVAYLAARNATMAIAIILVLFIWGGELKTFALSLAALAAAFAIACKELIMSALGSFLRVAQRLYAVGDVIEIQAMRGEVIEINFFTTVLMEHGQPGQVTGQFQEFPHMFLLLHPVRRKEKQGLFSLEQVSIPLDPTQDDIIKSADNLEQVALDVCKDWMEAAHTHFRTIERTFMIQLPEGRPVVFIEPVDAKRVNVIARFPCPIARRMRASQDILRRFYQNDQAHNTPSPALVAGSDHEVLP